MRCFGDTQILAHVKEKEYMLGQVIDKETEDLEQYSSYVLEARNDVNDVKFSRDKLRKINAQMSRDCGLLDKPELLRDYDDLIETIQNKRNKIEQLKKNINKMTKKMHHIMKQMGENEFVKKKPETVDDDCDNEDIYIIPRIRKGIRMVREGIY